MDRLSLFELNNMVRMAIEGSFPDCFWVEAELMEIRESRGHCYMELVQKDLFSSAPVARASAKCWRSQWEQVGAKFEMTAGSMPCQGMKLLLKVKVDFHPAYGYSLIISDIDPAYTLGEMAQRRQEVIRILKDEGVYDLQKELALPLFCQRIAVISSATAAGYGDFCNHIKSNEYGFRFDVELFPASMQGELVSRSIISCLDEIHQRIDCFDCVVIIRGGGAVSDMSAFDSLELAENVANFPLPVITGIGHERDECVLDLISFMKVKTPTAAAAYLVEYLKDADERIDDARASVLAAVSVVVERCQSRLSQVASRLSSSARLYCARKENDVELLSVRIGSVIQQRMKGESHRLELMMHRLKALDPKTLLKRGYSMTLANGKIVRDASVLKSGEELETVFEKGRIKSIVK